MDNFDDEDDDDIDEVDNLLNEILKKTPNNKITIEENMDDEDINDDGDHAEVKEIMDSFKIF